MEELASEHSDILFRDTSMEEKRSVHTKFKLSEKALSARERLGDYWEVTQKEVAEGVAKKTDQIISREERDAFVRNASSREGELTRKTHVVSEKTRNFLERTARELNLTRDQFFDAALRLVHTMVQQKRKEQIECHEELLPALRDLLDHTDRVHTKVEKLIDDEDPLGGTTIFGKLKHLENIVSALEEEVQRGEPLESDFDFWSFPSEDDFVKGSFDQSESERKDESDDYGQASLSSDVVQVEPEAPEDLTHTKVLKAEFGGQRVSDPNWNKLLKIAHEKAIEEMGSFREVSQVTNSNIKEGKFDKKGFQHYVTSRSKIPDFSIQGKKARTAWPDILHLAQNLNTNVFVRFKWRDKEKAAHPGKIGILHWSG
ncbi:T4SS efffector SepA family protein [Salinibacter altiplanensis]|uniref:T4SS efffector SepA family protein n=1 Tax=Salinibacter altiplanensis TaxID=1803181 RepID=UPI000C9F8993|nr:hypothetical protein [Salinibacter altiplanensis]